MSEYKMSDFFNPKFDPAVQLPPSIPEAEGGHPEYLKLLDELRELHTRKAADYGRGVDPLANVRASVDFGVPAWVGVMIRANDKVHRIKSFIANGKLKNESVEDSLKDLAAYALLALVLFREQETGASVDYDPADEADNWYRLHPAL
jgi:hypothetical protein